MRKFFVALEAEEVEAPPPETTPEEVLDSATEVEEAHDEVTSSTTEVEEMQGAVDEGVEATDTLTDLGDTMAAKVADGEGLSEDAAKIAEITIESIRVRLGMPKTMGKMPSMESFRSPKSRQEATRIALEAGVLDTLKNIGTQIVEFIKRMIEKFKVYFAGLIKNYGALENHLKKLKGMAEKVEGSPNKAEIEKGSLATFFSKEGKSNLETAMYAISTSEKFSKIFQEVGKYVAGKSDAAAMADMDEAKAKTEAAAHSAGLVDVIKSAGLDAKTEGDTTKFGPLPGNQWLTVKADKDGGNTVSFEAGKEPAKTIAALSKDEILKLINSALTLVEGGKAIKDHEKLVSGSLNDMIKASGKITSKMAKEVKGDEAKSASIKAAFKVIQGYTKALSSISSKLPGMHFATVKHSAEYAWASISNHKKADDKGEKKDDKEAAEKK